MSQSSDLATVQTNVGTVVPAPLTWDQIKTIVPLTAAQQLIVWTEAVRIYVNDTITSDQVKAVAYSFGFLP